MDLKFNIPEHLYKDAIFANGVNLKEITKLDIIMEGDSKTVRFFRRLSDGQRKAISVDIPYYEKHHPEKLKATSFNIFGVFEYTKEDTHTSTEIDWREFKRNFDECLLKICNL